MEIPAGAVVVVDGVFLLHPALVSCWDLTVWLDVDFDEVISRATHRDTPWVGRPKGSLNPRPLALEPAGPVV